MRIIGINRKKGSITVESAIAVPVFICAIITIAYIMKIVLIHEMIQHAITETANEIASCSYIYSVSGIQEIHDTASEKLSTGENKVEEQLTVLLNSYDCFNSFKGNLEKNIDNSEGISEISFSIEQLKESLNDSENVAKEIIADPKQEMKYIAYLLAKQGLEKAKTEVILKPLIKALIIKHIRISGQEKVKERLMKLNIAGGFDGLDFSKSKLFEDTQNINIVVNYRIRPEIPFNIFPEYSIEQKAVARGWLDGDADEAEDIWALGDFERGRKIQTIYGRNLPDNFKTISKFENGIATHITSINLMEKTYQKKPRIIISQINKVIRDLKYFEKDRKVKDEEGRTIEYYVTKGDIKIRRIIIVIPKGSSSKSFEAVFNECRKNARNNGIELFIEEL